MEGDAKLKKKKRETLNYQTKYYYLVRKQCCDA